MLQWQPVDIHRCKFIAWTKTKPSKVIKGYVDNLNGYMYWDTKTFLTVVHRIIILL